MQVADPDLIQLRFFDLTMRMTSDWPSYTELFKQMYARFKDSGTPFGNMLKVTIQTFPPHHSAERALLKINGHTFTIDQSEVVEGYIYELILREIVSRVKSHLLVHAGAVTTNGRGIILAGDSCHGKTTLVLELVRRGFGFLSDEMAALGRLDRRLYPFPRSLRIRPRTLELTKLAAAAESAVTWLDKLILDIEQIKPCCMGCSAPISHIIILTDDSRGHGGADPPPQPDFQSAARITPIEKSQAVRELLKKFQGGRQSALLREDCNGSAVKLFAETSYIIAGAACHQLQVGPLADMADFVCAVCGHVPLPHTA